MPAQLWDTTMNPATRVLKQVGVDDVLACGALMGALMGDDVPPRRDFIISNVHSMASGDLDY